MPLRLDNPRVSVDLGDSWEELAGVTRIAIDEQHQPIDGWPDVDAWLKGNGTGEMRGILAALEDWTWALTRVELALLILRPHLDRERLYVG